MSRGPAPINKPDFFTLDWFIEQKKLGKIDDAVANELHVSRKVLIRWKKEVGYKPETRRGRPAKFSYEDVKRLKLSGHSHNQIADKLDISLSSVVNVSKMMKEGKI